MQFLSSPPAITETVVNSPAKTSARDLALIIFKHKWSAAIIILTSLVGVLFWLYCVREDTYELDAKIMVRIGQEQMNTSTVSGMPILITGERSQDVNSEVDILTSADLLDSLITYFHLDQPGPPKPPPGQLIARIRFEVRQAVRDVREWWSDLSIRMGLRERLSPRERAMIELRSRLTVVSERNSNIISIQLMSPEREGAAEFLNKLLDMYKDFRLRLYGEQENPEFFQDELNRSSNNLQKSEQELRGYEDRWGISALQTQKEVLLDQIASAQSAVRNAEIEYNEAAAMLARAESELKSANPNFAAIGALPAQSFASNILQQMAELQKELEALRMTELDSGLRIRNNRNQFRVLLNLLTTNLRSTAEQNRKVLEARQQNLQELQDRIHSLQDKEEHWDALKRNSKILEDNYVTYHKKVDEATASSKMQRDHIGNVAVIEHATDPTIAGMLKFRIIGLTLIASLFITLCWIACAEYLDHGIYTVESLEEHISAPVFEAVPIEKRRSVFSRANAGAIDTSFRRTAWMIANDPSSRNRCLFFSSTAHGEGTTSAVLKTARHLSELYSLNTLVVELERERPTLVKKYELDEDKTLDAFVSGRLSALDCIQKGKEQFSLLPGALHPSEAVLTPDALRKLLEAVRSKFDVVLFDASPVPTANALGWTTVVGTGVLIIEAGQTRYEVVDHAVKELGLHGVRLFGGILNRQRRFIPGWAYRLVFG